MMEKKSYHLQWKETDKAMQKYSTTEINYFGVIIALEHFENYMRVVHITIAVDYAALIWMLNQKETREENYVRFLNYNSTTP